MVYDSAHAQIVFFGGVPDPNNPTYPNDTWTWDGASWTKQSPATKPPGRAGFGMAYDSARGKLVIFGGSSTNGFLNDTWEWDGANWTQKANGPGFLLHVGMAYDAARQQTVLYGGSVGTPFPLANTWVWDGTAWTQKFPATNPGPRSNFRMAYDARHQQIVMFGGWNGSTEVNETWVWDGTNWTPKSPANPPSPRQDFGIAYDSNRQRVVLFSGILPPSVPADDLTYEWDGTNWAQDTPAQNPAGNGRGGVSIAYDAVHSQVVMFGGANSSQIFADTWLFGAAGSSSSFFAALVQNGVAPPSVGPGHISTFFQPANSLTLRQAACIGGYDHFNWLQTVTADTGTSNPLFQPYDLLRGLTYCVPGYVNGIWTVNSCAALPTAPYFDPPRGGYVYQGASVSSPVEDNLNWYEDEVFTDGPPFVISDPSRGQCSQLKNAEGADFHCSDTNSRLLAFEDEPSCEIPILGLSCTVDFSTVLVGVRSGKTGDVLSAAGTGFDWHVIGTTIGIDQRRQNFQPDPGTLVYFDGFKQPGTAGFSQPELELFAKNGVNVRDEAGITIPVIIEIKPGSFPNSINPRSNGKTPVAIISTTGFQAPIQVDQSSLTFGHSGDEQSLAFCHSEDVNGDGLLDLVCHFHTPLTGFQTGDRAGVLKGKTVSGTPIYGADSVVIIPSH
jgi:hypothetical protein